MVLTPAGPPLCGVLRACGAGRTGSLKSEVRILSILLLARFALQVILEKMARPEGLFGPVALTPPGPPLRGVLRTCGAGRTGSLKSEVRRSSIKFKARFVLLVMLENMAHFEGETSNRLFQTLEEWDEFLKKYAPFFKEVA
ncbi:hypothetical protein [Candidatus Thiodiazotropha sp. LNASS1]|uniref:hypothetical protein n=1 Tax=Candidatus Thiodiazotropha sp. LNASS1 TaxID=3096260 RepID=UPI0034DFE6BB